MSSVLCSMDIKIRKKEYSGYPGQLSAVCAKSLVNEECAISYGSSRFHV